MSPFNFLTTVLDPGLSWCAALPGWHIVSDDRARVLMLAIAGQESNWTYRVQSGNGPAHSHWQMERMGGVHGVLAHPSSAAMARVACAASHVQPIAELVWGVFATEKGDKLATAFARLLLLTDPRSLPAAEDEDAGWEYYLRNWRPGAPSRERWADVFPRALAAVTKQNELKGHAP